MFSSNCDLTEQHPYLDAGSAKRPRREAPKADPDVSCSDRWLGHALEGSELCPLENNHLLRHSQRIDQLAHGGFMLSLVRNE